MKQIVALQEENKILIFHLKKEIVASKIQLFDADQQLPAELPGSFNRTFRFLGPDVKVELTGQPVAK